MKRTFDILASLAGLILLAPLLAVLALLVKCSSPGPALFGQRRVGQGGQPFTLYKFRTMRTGADPYGASPRSGEDPRLTRVGRFLRETSLDELPQLWNVLIGEMSLVGPRPLYQRQAALWTPRQRRRLDVRPGITGHAQVEGRGEIPIEDKIELDLYYVENRSLALDVKILWKTLTGALAGRGEVYESRYSRTRLRESDADGLAGGRDLQAVVFDLDDTLYPEREYIRSGYGAVAERLRDLLGTKDAYEDWLWRRFQAGQADGAFDALNEAMALGLSAETIGRLVETYRTHVPRIAPRPGAMEVLGALSDRFRLGLLTDGYLPAQRQKLQALKLERFFEHVLFTEELGRQAWKPAETGFEALERRFDLPPAALAYVGDNPSKDFLPGNRRGWLTIRLISDDGVHAARPAPPGGAAQVAVASLEELRDRLLARYGGE